MHKARGLRMETKRPWPGLPARARITSPAALRRSLGIVGDERISSRNLSDGGVEPAVLSPDSA